jgi:hypothetical protein
VIYSQQAFWVCRRCGARNSPSLRACQLCGAQNLQAARAGIVALLLLAGCASSTPSTYERGTFAAPPPAAVRPGVGAPVVGQPRAGAPEYPRSPYSRELPPTREPGIWASETASIADTAEEGFLLFTKFSPIPGLPLDATDFEKLQGGICGAHSGLAILLSAGGIDVYDGVIRQLEKWPLDERQCVLARLFHNCIAIVNGHYARRGSRDEIKRLFERSGEFKRLVCEDVGLSPKIEKFYGRANLKMGEFHVKIRGGR